MEQLNVLSLGAGVQSTTMLLMACHGEFETKPDLVIFADTGWEPKKVYNHVQWLKKTVSQFGVEIITASNGNIRTDTLRAAQWKTRTANMPYYVQQADGSKGIIPRGCSDEYKIDAIYKAVRSHLGLRPRQRMKPQSVVKWLGISTDEVERMKTSRNKWEVLWYPLIEKRMNRLDCMNWLERNGYPIPPKSACIGCPFHNDRAWLEIKRHSPEEWQEAVDLEKALHEYGLRQMRGKVYLHKSCRPLEEVDLNENQMDLFDDDFINECSGHCAL
ncbi:hypothetical protein [Bacillus sp. FJAT-26390]|uniref:hypothetical protein n=1 Tax=Bacillus sp. FJAT-26390 TaxID=1743142 RepID=UPI000807CBB3|nr:hypothetical protein [Bacillus sp. FJAT-26390]OBZ13305.1 hypothetical protein A7975_10630 [Bacillus sp. FJAT-26390]